MIRDADCYGKEYMKRNLYLCYIYLFTDVADGSGVTQVMLRCTATRGCSTTQFSGLVIQTLSVSLGVSLKEGF